jgi:hypothetical protein
MGSDIYLLFSRGPSARIDSWQDFVFRPDGIEDFASNFYQGVSCTPYFFFSRNVSTPDYSPSFISQKGLMIIALGYLTFSYMSTLVFPESQSSKKDSFNLYSSEIPILKYSIYPYIPVAFTNCLFSTFVSAELLESLPLYRKLLRISDREKPEYTSRIGSRLLIWTASIAVTGLFSNVLTIISAAGSLFAPLVGYLAPLVYYYSYHLSRRTGTISPIKWFVDSLLIVITIIFMYLSIRNVVLGKFE